jgi:hypothetical protein
VRRRARCESGARAARVVDRSPADRLVVRLTLPRHRQDTSATKASGTEVPSPGVAMSQVEIVRRVYEAGAAQDLEGVLDLADTACIITQDPSLPLGRSSCRSSGPHRVPVGPVRHDRLRGEHRGTVRSRRARDPVRSDTGCGADERGDLRAARSAHLDGQEQQGRRRACRYRHAGDASGA